MGGRYLRSDVANRDYSGIVDDEGWSMGEDMVSRLNRRELPCPVCAAGDGEPHTFECVEQRYGRDTAVEWVAAGVWDGSFESPRPGAGYAVRMREYLNN